MIFRGCFAISLIETISCGLIKSAQKKSSNIRYFTIYVIWMVLCLLIQYLPNNDTIVNNNLDKIFGFHGIEIVYRACFALGLSYFVQFLLTLMWPFLHHMVLGVFFVIIAFFSWLFIWYIDSNQWVITFRNVAKYGAGAYLVLQLMAFVDFAFTCHEFLLSKIDETNARYRYTDKTCCCRNQYSSFYITLCFVLGIGSVVATIAFYSIFKVDGSFCGRNVFVITMVLIISIITHALSLSEKFGKGWLPSCIIVAITTFYLLNALLSNSDTECNPFVNVSNYWITAINVFLTITSGYWMAYRVVNEEADKEDVEEGKDKIVVPDDDSFQWCIFNFCMVLACCYLAMMCSAWYEGDITIRPEAIFTHTSKATFWVFNGSIWIGFAVYFYILFAPFLFESRSF